MYADTTDKPSPSQLQCRLPKWNIRGSDFALFIALVFAGMGFTSTLFGFVTNEILALPSEETPSPLIALAANLGMQLGMLFGFLAYHKFYPPREPLAPTEPIALSKKVTIGLKWLLFAYPVMIAVNLTSRTILDALGYEQVIQDPIRMVLEGGSPVEIFMMYSMIVLVAPICEEIAFRAGIFRYLHLRLPLYGSLALSAFLFALLHGNLYSFAPLMTIGVMLAFAYRESGSILSSITFHAAFNSINLLLILLFPELI